MVERARFLWIWLGDPTRVDESAIPDHHWLSDAGYARVPRLHTLPLQLLRLHENVLDLTHFPYVHGEAVGGLDYIKAPAQVVKEGNQVAYLGRDGRERSLEVQATSTLINVREFIRSGVLNLFG